MTPTQRRALLATIIGSGVVFLDGSVVNLALPKIAASLHTDFVGLQWIIDGYLLTLSALILLGGSLGDVYGRKKIYFWGIVGFGLTSLLCAVAPNIEILVLMRLLQGVFGALMVPGALAIINTNFSPELRGKAIGLWTASTSGIVAIGPLIGGSLVDLGPETWRLIFLINAPLLAATLWLGAATIKESLAEITRHIDVGGALLAVLGLGGLTYGLIEGPATHWNTLAVTSLICGALSFVLFVFYERRHKDPMLEPALFKSANFTGVNITTFAMYGGLGGFFFALTIYLQTTLHYSSRDAGLSSLPVTLCMIFLSSRAGALAGKYGPRLFMTIGPILTGVGILTLLPLHDGSSYVFEVLPGILLFGIGLATTVSPLTTTVLASVKETDSGIASAVNNAVSRVSGLVVISLLGVFGAAHAFQFAVVLCGAMAIVAGVLSFVFIRNEALRKSKLS